MLSEVPDEGFQSCFVEALAHPVEGRAEVVDELLAREGAAYFVGEGSCFGDVRVSGLDPEEVGVGSELLGALGGGREAGAVVVESLAGARAIAGPDHRSLGVVAGEGSSAGEGEVGILLHALLVCVSGGVGGSLSLEVRVDG